MSTKCETCIHKEACQAWITHGTSLYDDYHYSVKGLRTLIKRNLNKEVHPATKPSDDCTHYETTEILSVMYQRGFIDGNNLTLTKLQSSLNTLSEGCSSDIVGSSIKQTIQTIAKNLELAMIKKENNNE